MNFLIEVGMCPARASPNLLEVQPVVYYVGRGPTAVKKFFFMPDPTRDCLYGP